MDGDIELFYVSGGIFLMNIHNISETKNHNSIVYTKKRDGNVTNVSEMEDTRLQDCVDIDDMLSTFGNVVKVSLNQEEIDSNMETGGERIKSSVETEGDRTG